MIPDARQWPTFEVTARTCCLSGSSASAKKCSSSTHQSRLNRVIVLAETYQMMSGHDLQGQHAPLARNEPEPRRQLLVVERPRLLRRPGWCRRAEADVRVHRQLRR